MGVDNTILVRRQAQKDTWSQVKDLENQVVHLHQEFLGVFTTQTHQSC